MNPIKAAKSLFHHGDDGPAPNTWAGRSAMRAYDGNVTVCVLEAKDLIKSDLLGSVDPYAVVHTDSPPGKPENEHKTEDLTATESFTLACTSSHVVVFDLWDKDTLKGDDAIGSVTIDLSTLEGQGTLDDWHEVQQPNAMAKRWMGEKIRANAKGAAHKLTLGAVSKDRNYGQIRLQLTLNAEGGESPPAPAAAAGAMSGGGPVPHGSTVEIRHAPSGFSGPQAYGLFAHKKGNTVFVSTDSSFPGNLRMFQRKKGGKINHKGCKGKWARWIVEDQGGLYSIRNEGCGNGYYLGSDGSDFIRSDDGSGQWEITVTGPFDAKEAKRNNKRARKQKKAHKKRKKARGGCGKGSGSTTGSSTGTGSGDDSDSSE